MILGEKVSSIAKNKHYKSGNYNAGIVKLQCFVNEYCPFDNTDYVDHNLLFNDETMKLAPQSIRNQYSSIPGELGIYLKPKFIYHSNFLRIKDKQNNLELVGSGSALDLILDAQIKDPAKFEEYSWEVLPHPFLYVYQRGRFPLPRTIPSESEVLSFGGSIDVDPQRWSASRLNRTIQKGDKTEFEDGNVIYNFQTASSPNINNANYKNPGVHWRVGKMTPIFRGEDFFI